VDGAQCRLAAQRPAAHPVQYDVGPAARPLVRRTLRRGTHGHHLHRRRGGRVPASSVRGCSSAGFRSWAAPDSR
jgi:hypothetical protein